MDISIIEREALNLPASAHQHPKRPIEGFDCARSEVSGRRLWGWAALRFGSAETFFAERSANRPRGIFGEDPQPKLASMLLRA